MSYYSLKQLQRFHVLEGKDEQVLSREDKVLAVELGNVLGQKLLDLGASELNYRKVRRRDGRVQYVAYCAKYGLREWVEATSQWVEMRLSTMLDVVQDLLVNH